MYQAQPRPTVCQLAVTAVDLSPLVEQGHDRLPLGRASPASEHRPPRLRPCRHSRLYGAARIQELTVQVGETLS